MVCYHSLCFQEHRKLVQVFAFILWLSGSFWFGFGWFCWSIFVFHLMFSVCCSTKVKITWLDQILSASNTMLDLARCCYLANLCRFADRWVPESRDEAVAFLALERLWQSYKPSNMSSHSSGQIMCSSHSRTLKARALGHLEVWDPRSFSSFWWHHMIYKELRYLFGTSCPLNLRMLIRGPAKAIPSSWIPSLICFFLTRLVQFQNSWLLPHLPSTIQVFCFGLKCAYS